MTSFSVYWLGIRSVKVRSCGRFSSRGVATKLRACNCGLILRALIRAMARSADQA